MEVSDFSDDFGPEKVIFVSNAVKGLKGVLVIDNTCLGPGKGGVRFVKDITAKEVMGLARAMTWKNSMAGLPFGGAKAGVVYSEGQDRTELMRAFAEAVRAHVPEYYIAGPDMNTTEHEMQAFAETIGDNKAATGKPLSMKGLPHELGSTGFGVAEATEIALQHKKIPVKGATIAIEGFGNVGTFTAQFLSEKGAKIIAVSDSKGTLHVKEGIDVKKLMKVKKEKGSVIEYGKGKVLTPQALFGLDVDVLIPGARPNVITEQNVDNIKATIIVEAANIPMTTEMELRLHNNGVLIVPDFIANAGGVISSYVEYSGGTQEEMFKIVKEKIHENTELVLTKAEEEKELPRFVAKKIARERIVCVRPGSHSKH